MPTEATFSFPVFSSLSLDAALGWLLLTLAAVFCIHAIIAIYHWFTYGSEPAVSLLSSVLYVCIGGGLLLLMGLVLLLF